MTNNGQIPETATGNGLHDGHFKQPCLMKKFEDNFEVRIADKQYLKDQAYRLRYHVYCVENNYENPADHPHGLELDEYDEHSVHCLLFHEPTATFAGTARLILPHRDRPQQSFPIQKICSNPVLRDPGKFPVPLTGEISRFCIAKAFYQNMKHRPGRSGVCGRSDPNQTGDQDLFRHTKLGLMQGLLRICIDHGILHLCCEMEPILLRLLARLGLHWKPVGPLVEHHGLRQPCMASMSDLLQGIWDRDPESWAIFTAGGKYANEFLAMEREILRSRTYAASNLQYA